jgi:hypothetical protein
MGKDTSRAANTNRSTTVRDAPAWSVRAPTYDGPHVGRRSYVGPRSAPRRQDHDTFEIQTVHVQPRVNRHAPTRPSLVRMSQMPLELDDFRRRLRARRAWPYLALSAAVAACLLCWLAWPVGSTATPTTDPGASADKLEVLSEAADRDQIAVARKLGGAGRRAEANDRADAAGKAGGLLVERPVARAAVSDQLRQGDPAGVEASSVLSPGARVPPSAKRPDPVLLKRPSWSE